MTLASVSLPSVKHVSHRTDTFERTQDASVNLNDFDLASEKFFKRIHWYVVGLSVFRSIELVLPPPELLRPSQGSGRAKKGRGLRAFLHVENTD